MESTSQKEILTTQGAMELLQVGRTTLYRLCKQGKITSYKMFGKLYFMRSEIIAAIEAGKQEPEAAEINQAA